MKHVSLVFTRPHPVEPPFCTWLHALLVQRDRWEGREESNLYAPILPEISIPALVGAAAACPWGWQREERCHMGKRAGRERSNYYNCINFYFSYQLIWFQSSLPEKIKSSICGTIMQTWTHHVPYFLINGPCIFFKSCTSIGVYFVWTLFVVYDVYLIGFSKKCLFDCCYYLWNIHLKVAIKNLEHTITTRE